MCLPNILTTSAMDDKMAVAEVGGRKDGLEDHIISPLTGPTRWWEARPILIRNAAHQVQCLLKSNYLTHHFRSAARFTAYLYLRGKHAVEEVWTIV